MIGDPKHLAFEIAWPSQEPADLRGLGWGEFKVWLSGNKIWTLETRDSDRGVDWTWIDLVEHLARAWGHLLHEEIFPFGLLAAGPEALRARTLLASVPGKTADEVEDAVHAFQHRHDLAAGLKGIELPPIWLLREGTQMRIRAEGHDLWRPCDEVIRTLTDLVDTIRARVASPAPRAKLAFERWDTRAPSEDLVLRLQTGLSAEQLASFPPEGIGSRLGWWGSPPAGRRTAGGRARRPSEKQPTWRGLHPAASDVHDTPLRAVARLSQSLAEATRIALVRAIAEVAPRSTPKLDALAEEAAPVLDAVADEKPYAQGHRLAQWLRSKRAITDGHKVVPEELLRDWGVELRNLERLEPALDAVACWGDRGPAVLVNPAGMHASSNVGRAATLAHEIGHLIMDRLRSLPLAEVFGGATPLHLEQRARAFAAELLLPREVAHLAVVQAASLQDAVNALQRDYSVSKELIGWQIRNGSAWALLDRAERKEVASWLRERRGTQRSTYSVKEHHRHAGARGSSGSASLPPPRRSGTRSPVRRRPG
jgi:hypothetical protein